MEMQELMTIFDMGDGGLDLEDLDFLGGIRDEDIQLSQLYETVKRDYALKRHGENVCKRATGLCGKSATSPRNPWSWM